MNARLTRISSALIIGAAFAANAHAEYRCAPAPTQLDERACLAAQESPEALRRFVQRLHWFTGLYYFDYVNENTAQAWETQSSQEAAQKSSHGDAIIIAASETE